MEWTMHYSQGDARTRYQGVPTDRSTTLGDEGITRSSLYKVQKGTGDSEEEVTLSGCNLVATSLHGCLWWLQSVPSRPPRGLVRACLREDLASAPTVMRDLIVSS